MVAQNHALVITELPGRLRIKKKRNFSCRFTLYNAKIAARQKRLFLLFLFLSNLRFYN